MAASLLPWVQPKPACLRRVLFKLAPDQTRSQQAGCICEEKCLFAIAKSKGCVYANHPWYSRSLLACRLARKKAPELRSVSEACLASLVAHDMAEFRTRNANLGKAPDNSRTAQLVQLRGTQTKRTAKHKRFAHHTRATICGCRPNRMSTSMSNGFIAILNSTSRIL